MTCNACAKDIADGRSVSLAVQIHWADDRPDWKGLKGFCSFACASDWLREKAEEHDSRTVVEGVQRTEPHDPVVSSHQGLLKASEPPGDYYPGDHVASE